MSFWNRLQPRRGAPSPESIAELKKSKQELARVEAQSSRVQQVSSWLDMRNRQNHFGDALTISFTPRRRRHV